MSKISTEVGSAYLLVTPKLSNDAGSKLAAGGATSGASYGGKFSNAAKGAISAGAVAMGNILSTAVQAVASGIGQAFADMFQGAMDYEQLAGGVEKIFDQADISGIMADANNAYKDLNMSANEYLAAINQTGAAFAQTMGDQKGYDTARTGMKAIADYASGTGRNIDELNEKFSLITRSTSSYQSIADQFSGILPATSKDFLAQAQAAGFLSESYTKLTDVPIAEYQEAVSKMLEKGVADMGLAGNTAMESAETMSGSLAMLKSSWSNFLTSILDENADLEASFGALLESIMAVVANFAPRIGLLFVRIFQKLPQALIDAIMALPDTLLPALQSVFGEQIGQAISDDMRGALEFVATSIADLMDGITSAILPVVEVITETVQDNIPVVQDIIGDAMSFIGGIVRAVWPTVSNIIKGAMSTISAIIIKVWPQIRNIISNVMKTIKNVLSTAWPAIKSLISSVMSAIDSIMSVAWPIIRDVVSTVMSAILVIIQTVWPAIQGIIQTVINAISRIISGMSAFIGTVTGIFESVKRAIENPMRTAQSVVDGAASAISGIFNGLSPVVGTVSWIFEGVKSAIENPMGTAQSVVDGAASTISGILGGLSSVVGTVSWIFESVKRAIAGPLWAAQGVVEDIVNTIEWVVGGMNLQLPSIALPHFWVSGGEFPWGIGGAGSMPSFGVDWYAKGGIVDGATLIGAGEAGPEMILPKSGGLMDVFSEAVASKVNGGVTVYINDAQVNSDSEIQRQVYGILDTLKRKGAM